MCVHRLWRMQHSTHSDDMKTWNHLHTLQLLLDPLCPLHVLFIFQNPFVSPFLCTHMQHGSSTFFLFLICTSIRSELCNETLPSDYFKKLWLILQTRDSSYYWLLQVKHLFPTGANKTFLFWISLQPLRHDQKILYNSVHGITHLNYSPNRPRHCVQIMG